MPERSTFRLRTSGETAEIAPDPLVPGAWVLSVGGTEQSHVDLGDPGSLFYDYVRRIGAVIDRIAPPGRPLRTVHLGAGALTLARYLQATRPGSEQLAVELEAGLLAEVASHLPLPAGTSLTVHEGDAAAVVAALLAEPDTTPAAATTWTGRAEPDITPAARAGSADTTPPAAARWGGHADLVVDDLYRGLTTPAHLTTAGWYASLARLLGPRGVLVVNVADDDGLPGLRSRLRALTPSLPHRLVLGPTGVLADARAGNAVIVASRDPALLDLADDLRRAGPHPSAALDAADLRLADLHPHPTPRGR